ncbi:MAG: cyclase family protein [Proteobacteria bacterium]|nr:cyclase family protein [Pseudomonadota bacterium]
MPKRWRRRPEGSNWGEFGADDQLGRLNLITAERRLAAVREVTDGLCFCLSLPLDLPGGNALNPDRRPPRLKPVMRDGHLAFDLAMECVNPLYTDLTCDEAVVLESQYMTQWDALAHKGSMFDADGDGRTEHVYYNGFQVVDAETRRPRHGAVGAAALGIEHMAATGVQGRGVMIDLGAHFGNERRHVGYDDLMRVMAADGVVVEAGDMVCLHTGLGQLLLDMGADPDPELARHACAVLDGADKRLLEWITESGLSVLVSDNLAVERSAALKKPGEHTERGPALPLHEHCLFKIGVHLGELWYLSELAAWLRERQRYRFLLTAPPLWMPGAVGSPLTPVATV